MGLMHGLAVVLILLEGTIIQCESILDGISLEWIKNAPVIDINGAEPIFPNDIFEVIVSKADFETAGKIIGLKMINATDIAMEALLRDRIIMIIPHKLYGQTEEYFKDGDLILRFGKYRRLESFFEKFGDYVKKIEICYAATSYDIPERSIINKNIINKYAKNFDELRISNFDDEGLWEEMSNGQDHIVFPEVTTLKYFGDISRSEFKLNLIFPKLEFFELIGSVADTNCLEHVTTLKDLRLRSRSIQEHQLDHIFANNRNMRKVSISSPIRWQTMQAIAHNLTQLETLEVKFPGPDFLFRTNNQYIKYKLASVKHFDILFLTIDDIIGNLSFEMPTLKKLSLIGGRVDSRIIDFIEHFKELDTIELITGKYNYFECIEKFKNIKEFTVSNFENSQLTSLRKMFEHFDKKSKLEILKLSKFNESEYRDYENTMTEINNHLENSKKPTWKLSIGDRKGIKCLMFTRQPCKCESCKK